LSEVKIMLDKDRFWVDTSAHTKSCNLAPVFLTSSVSHKRRSIYLASTSVQHTNRCI